MNPSVIKVLPLDNLLAPEMWGLKRAFLLRSGEVEAVKVHYLVPRRYEVVHELLLGVLASVDFRQGPELGVRTENEVDTGAGPIYCDLRARNGFSADEYHGHNSHGNRSRN